VKRISKSISEMYEMDSEIRFKKKLKFVKRISESVSEKYETDFGIYESDFKFQESMKRIPKSVSRKKIKICETDFGIRFILF